jgi:formylglycine-generating enzyme required for sulfatase activity
MVMVYVPGGTFQMGSDESDSDAGSDEFPQHSVTLDPFWIDQTEVTNAQYALCVADGECEESAYADDTDYNGDDYPVVGVSWNDAAGYCAWAGAQLPTEAQWEYAAKGTQGYIYPWGDIFDGTRVSFCDSNCTREWKANDYHDGYERTAPVGSFPDGASWCDARDLAGNVWEWTADWYSDYSSRAQTNPTGPAEGEYKVLRGGGWFNKQWDVRASARAYDTPTNRSSDVGFRCIMQTPGQ